MSVFVAARGRSAGKYGHAIEVGAVALKRSIGTVSDRTHRERDGKPRPEGRGFASLRLVGVSGLAIELHLIGELDLGEEWKHDGDGELQLALMGQLRDLPVDELAKAAAGFLAEGYERFHEVILFGGCA